MTGFSRVRAPDSQICHVYGATWIACCCCCVCARLRCPGVTQPAALKNIHLEQRERSTTRCAPLCHFTCSVFFFFTVSGRWRWSLSRHQLGLSGVFVQRLTDVILMLKSDERTKRGGGGADRTSRETSHETMFGQAWMAGESIKAA